MIRFLVIIFMGNGVFSQGSYDAQNSTCDTKDLIVNSVSQLYTSLQACFDMENSAITHVLPPLPYPRNALEPDISEEIVKLHYDGHHNTYVKKLNAELEKAENEEFRRMTIDDLIRIKDLKAPLFNNAAQIYNHTFFWNSLAVTRNSGPDGKIAELINESYESWENAIETGIPKGAGHFASGWLWLVLKDSKIVWMDTHDAGNPFQHENVFPLAVIDLWEHSYYIQYKSDRLTYLRNCMNRINWDFVKENFEKYHN